MPDRHVDQEGQPPAVDVEPKIAGRGRSASRRGSGRPPHRRRTWRRTPRTRGCAAGPAGKVVVISASAAGEASAAPRPWRPRAPSSSASFCARPPSSEATAKIDEADHEDAAAAVEVAEPAAEQQQAAEGQRVAGDDPGQVRLADVEVGLDVGQRDVGDGARRAPPSAARRRSARGPSRGAARVLGRARLPASGVCVGVGHEFPSLRWCRSGVRVAGGEDDLVDHRGDRARGWCCSPRRKTRCRTMPGEGGREQVEVEVRRGSRRGPWPARRSARDAAILGPRNSRRNAVGELRVAADGGEDGGQNAPSARGR